MSDELINIIIRVLTFPIALVIAVIVLSLKKLSLKDNFGLGMPTKREAILWLLLYIPVFALTEVWYFGLGLNEGRVWQYTPVIMVVRAVGIIILAPITEELLFRGVIFKRIADAKPGPIGAIILTTVIFTGVHFQYGILDLTTIFVDALYWAWVRYKTGSTILPIIMHVFANSMAVIEFIWINRLI